jgi:hypothetical protein
MISVSAARAKAMRPPSAAAAEPKTPTASERDASATSRKRALPFEIEAFVAAASRLNEGPMVHGAQAEEARKLGVEPKYMSKLLARYRDSGRLPTGRRGPSPVLGWGLEEALVDWVKRHQASFACVTCAMLQEKARQLARDNGIDETLVGGESWLAAFRRRHPELGLRLPQEIETARIPACSSANFIIFFDAYEKATASICTVRGVPAVNPEFVYNVDECGVSLRGMRSMVLAEAGKAAYTRRDPQNYHVSLIVCGNAGGKFIRPMIIFEGQRAMQKLLGGWDDVLLVMSESGYQELPTWRAFVDHFVASVKGPSILVSDGHSTRKDAAALVKLVDARCHLVILPSHTTHVSQPLDRTFFRPFKTAFRGAVARKQNSGITITKSNIAGVIKEAWDVVTAEKEEGKGCEILKSGFLATGLFPVDRSKLLRPEITSYADMLASKHKTELASSAAAAAGDDEEEDEVEDDKGVVVETEGDLDGTPNTTCLEATPGTAALLRSMAKEKGTQKAATYTSDDFLRKMIEKEEEKKKKELEQQVKKKERETAKEAAMAAKAAKEAAKEAAKAAKEAAKAAKAAKAAGPIVMDENEEEEEEDMDTTAAEPPARHEELLARATEVLAQAAKKARTQMGLLADKIIATSASTTAIPDGNTFMTDAAWKGAGIKVRVRYEGAEMEEEDEGHVEAYHTSVRAQWIRYRDKSFQDKMAAATSSASASKSK